MAKRKTTVTQPLLTQDEHQEWDRACDAVTLEQAWAVVMKAWRDRRRSPTGWRLLASNIHFVDLQQRGA